MGLSAKQKARMIAANREEYGEGYAQLYFPATAELQRLAEQRRQLLSRLAERVEVGCSGTKLDMRNLSPGCRICTEGGWSCLFISGSCNCDCFYCPTAQDELGLPTTNSVQFRHPADYASYLERFGFNGASISGGEPLLTPKRSLGFLSAIKRRFGRDLHVWLYTNGTLVNEDILLQLRDAGLDEIRFDIGATDYSLKKLKLATGIIPTLTVEIPAIPEELERLKWLLPELVAAGVQHLNLHQLRLTPYNFQRLQPRGYRYLHGDKVTVLDSELAALELLADSVDRGIDLPVNYCSFPYKNRFQARAARQRNAAFVGKPYEALTENAYLRSLTLLGSAAQLTALVERFQGNGCSPELWSLARGGERLSVHPQLWPLVELDGLRLLLSYGSARQLQNVTYRNPFVTVELSRRQKLIIERGRPLADLELNAEQAELFAQVFLFHRRAPSELPETDLWQELLAVEQLCEGLLEYF